MTEQTLIERVARALAPMAWAALGSGDTFAQKARRTASMRHARAAIEAMKQPTDAMLSATEGHSDDPATVWMTMIDAALGVEKGRKP